MVFQEEEDRQREYLQAQIERAKLSAKEDATPQASELKREGDATATPVQITLPKSRLSVAAPAAPKPAPAAFTDDDRPARGETSTSS